MIDVYFTQIKQQATRRAMHEAQHRAGRLLLFDVLGITEDALRYRENGKPYLPGGPFFNISHSGCLVVLAVSEEGEIGCDVEDTSRPIRNEEAFRKKIAQPGEEHLPLFALWVRYEARYKAGFWGQLHMLDIAEGYVAAICAEQPWTGKKSCDIKVEQKYFGI